MLEQRILATLKFFDLQDLALAPLEIHKFLMPEPEAILATSSGNNFLFSASLIKLNQPATLSEITEALSSLLEKKLIETHKGFYTLPGRQELVDRRLSNYRFSIPREKRIKRFLSFTRHIPFVRGIALGGSGALGLSQEKSDIDLLVLTDRRFIWIARTLLSLYFQIFGVRRHGNLIANRFCLNHYIGGIKELEEDRNIYTAMEYARLRPLIYKDAIQDFQTANGKWIDQIFPEWPEYRKHAFAQESQSRIQALLEKIIFKTVGERLNKWLSIWQLKRIKKDAYVYVSPDELSFHHQGKQHKIISEFYDYLNRSVGPKVEVNSLELETEEVD